MMRLKEATGQMPRLIGAVQATQAEKITTFNSSGTFAAQPKSSQADILVIAGGGGGAGQMGGGGGAGGYREISNHPIPLSPVPRTSSGWWWITPLGGTSAGVARRGPKGSEAFTASRGRSVWRRTTPWATPRGCSRCSRSGTPTLTPSRGTKGRSRQIRTRRC